MRPTGCLSGGLRPSVTVTINEKALGECLASLKDETCQKIRASFGKMCVYKEEDKTGQFSASLVYSMRG